MKKWIGLLSALAMTGCTKVGVGLANLPADFSTRPVEKNIAYGDKPWQKLDIFLPDEEMELSKPVLVFFYGGRWESGSRSMYKFVGHLFAKQGFVTVIPDYGKYPEVKFPAFVEDAASAVAWTDEHIAQYGGDAKRIFVVGHSSGAHLGALICADKHYLAVYGKTPEIIRGFAGLSGPYDFVPQEQDLKAMFGPPSNYPLMQVTTFIDGTEPPMLLLWGAADEVVARQNLDLLTAKIHMEGGAVSTKIYPDVGHVGMIAHLTWLYGSDANVSGDMLDFFHSQL